MRHSLKLRVGIVVAAMGALGCAALPASGATPATFTVNGGGTFAPGLTVTGMPQTWDYSGSGYAGGSNYVGPISCTWDGNDTVGTLMQGQGGFYGHCTTQVGTETLSGSYTRTGGAVNMSGTIGPAPYTGGFTAVCTVVPFPSTTTPNSYPTYQASCAFYTQ